MAAAVIALTAAARPALAAGPYDPTLTWHTLLSPRFAVHYPDGARNLGVRVSALAEEVLDDVGDLLGYVPDGRIEVVLIDNSDLANGSAQVSPQNTVRLILSAPTELTGLSSYDDWLRILLVHELAHICDIDQTWGVTRALRYLFGKSIQWNGFTPQFLSEGVAVYAETVLTPTGRGRSSYVAMVLRTAALENQFLSIDQAHIFHTDWPLGNGAYFYGGMFHLWLSQKYGREAVRDLHRAYASFPIPYVYYFGAREIFGKSLPALWDDWRQEETAFAQEVSDAVIARGVTPSRQITFHGRNLTGVRYSPDGSFLLFSRSSPKDGRTVRRIGRDGANDVALVLQTFSPRFSFTPDGAGFIYSQNAINERFNDFNDLYRYNLDDGSIDALRDVDAPGKSLRARDPAVSPDGNRVVFVQNLLHQNTLSVGTFVDEDKTEMRIRPLVAPAGDMQHASPQFSPDGAQIAVSTWFDNGYRDIVIIDANTGEQLRRVTYDEALDGNPEWSSDGRFVLYESDADGISNLYAFELATGRYFRITRVVGGAFQPDVSPDGRHLAFRNAHAGGFDIHEMPYDPATWLPVRYDPAQGYRENETPKTVPAAWNLAPFPRGTPRATEDPLPLPDTTEESAYSPWRTLLPFQDNWVLFPSFLIENGDPNIAVSTFGTDVLREHTYVASIGSSWFTQAVDWSFSYVNDMWFPSIGAGYSDIVSSFPATGGRVSQRRRTATGFFSLPVGQWHNTVFSYTYEQRDGRDARSARLFGIEGGERFAWLELGYRYANTQAFAHSVGREEGRTAAVAGRYYSRALGGDFDELIVTLDGRLYLNNPWWPNHVLALRGAAAIALGPDFEEQFALGGSGADSLFTTQTEQVYPLRGFLLDVDRYPTGTGLLAGYLEYRFPLWHVERGLWTYPFYVQRLHLALFADAGETFGDGSEGDFQEVVDGAADQLRRLRLGAGGEVRLDVNLGWGFLLTFRGGVGVPVLDGGRYRGGNPVFFFTLGGGL